MGFLNLLISLISGIVGGNIAGSAMKEKSLGGVGNSIAGLIGGGLGGVILQALGAFGAPGTGEHLGGVIGNIVGSGIGGAILTIIVALIKNAMSKPKM